MSDYQQVFKSKSTIELLYIVDSQSDYSNEAFEAATSELETRTDVDEWQLEMKRQKEEAEDKKDKTVSLEDAIKVKFLGL
ncbi:MAG: hypothetical protein ACPGWM_05405, partial [Flavobacteriales bacterium]